ncbi:amino acid ABC transporter substrate-binding protein [Pseudoroseomonas deserti]|uniref:Amino acid ABC transporter substrate-binding protein n=1 Tax=Teichococcus deserti TaxID=1817963 RepID=A0A1V2GYZ8_9PROT|nr:transporter substrate-binding domain-containing protein [Pseudoroseomonas deserti]ONG50136.1 amino acid ABC transporter substrate-binding protein [Pseudoroseomonas deserti]
MTITRQTFLRAGLAAGGLLAMPRLVRAKEWQVVRFATEGAFPPYNQTAPDGRIVGFEPDLLKDLSARLKIRMDLVAQDWAGMIPGLVDGKYDAIIDGISITPKREEAIAFTIPYTAGTSGFVTMKNTAPNGLPGTGTRVSLTDEAATKSAIAELATALRGKTVAVQVSTIQADFLTTYLKDAVTIRTYQAGGDTYLDLRAGRVDAVMASTSNMAAFVKRARGEALQSGYTFGGGVLGRGAAIGLRKTDPELKTLLDGAMQAAIADGTLKKLSMQWFETDITPAT